MYSYLCLNPIAEIGLREFGGRYTETSDPEAADVVLVRSAKMHGMELPERLLAIGRAGAGVNNIPVDECSERGIVVFNTPGANANGVKELVIAGMLLASRDIIGGIEWTREQEMTDDIQKRAEKQKKQFAGTEIAGKKLGVIGLGAIGVMVANTAAALGMEVYGYDPYVTLASAWHLSSDIRYVRDVDDIYRECDYISIHVPLNDSTRAMIDEDAVSRMKDGVVLLNFARDPLVDEYAVINALNSGKMKKYVTDFVTPDIAQAPNTLVTPHLGASTRESEDKCAVMAVRELRDFLENGTIKTSVNYPSCDMGKCTAAARVAVYHRNIPNTITKYTGVVSKAGANISNMVNVSRGEYSYTLMDIESVIGEDVLREMRQMDGVFRVRLIQGAGSGR